MTEHKQTRQGDLADRAWARGQEFLNPNPSPTAIFFARPWPIEVEGLWVLNL